MIKCLCGNGNFLRAAGGPGAAGCPGAVGGPAAGAEAPGQLRTRLERLF